VEWDKLPLMLNEDEASVVAGVSISFLRKSRCEGCKMPTLETRDEEESAPPFIKIGPKRGQKIERQALSESFSKGISRKDVNRQRSILATKHAYERAVLKEKQKKLRESSRLQSAAFMPYEQWLRNLNLPEEAEKWRHRKNRHILLLESPDDIISREPQEPTEYTGLLGFSMTVTRQGVKFASQDRPGAVAFVDVGHLIRVYDQGDRSILAALQLAQSKWGGVQVNGTDEYKRKCAELAVRHGIRLTNPELKAEVEVAPRSGMIEIKPEVGQRVTFHF
jgi:hypothetical protein